MTTHTATAMDQQTKFQAYYQGKWDASNEKRVPPCPYTKPELVKGWKEGVRDYQSDNRLNADTDWD